MDVAISKGISLKEALDMFPPDPLGVPLVSAIDPIQLRLMESQIETANMMGFKSLDELNRWQRRGQPTRGRGRRPNTDNVVYNRMNKIMAFAIANDLSLAEAFSMMSPDAMGNNLSASIEPTLQTLMHRQIETARVMGFTTLDQLRRWQRRGQVNQPAAGRGRGSAPQAPSNTGNIGPMAAVSTSDLAQRRSVGNRQSGNDDASTGGRFGPTAGGGSNLGDTVTQLARDIRSGGGNVTGNVSSQRPTGRPIGGSPIDPAGGGSAPQVTSNTDTVGPMAPVSTSDLAQRRSVGNRQPGNVGASTGGRNGLVGAGGGNDGPNLNNTVTQLLRNIHSGGGNVGSSQRPSGRPAGGSPNSPPNDPAGGGSGGGDDFENAMNRVADFAIANNIDVEEALLQFPTEAELLDGIAVDVMRGQINYARKLRLRSLAEYIRFQNKDNETRSLRLGSYPLSYWGALVAAGLDDTPPGPNSAAGSPTGGNDSGISGGSSNRPKVNNTMSPGLAGTTRSTGGNMSSPGGNSLVRASLNNTQAGSPGPAGSTSSSGRSAGLPGSPLRSPGQVNQPAAGRGSASQVPSNAGNIGPMAPVSSSDLAQRRSVSNRQSGIVGASTRGRDGLTAGGGSNLNDTVTQLTRDIRSGGGNVDSSQRPSGRPAGGSPNSPSNDPAGGGSGGGDDFENAMNRVADFAIANNIDVEEALLQFPTEAELLDGIAVDVMRGQINYARKLRLRSLAEYIRFQNKDNETRSLRLGSYPLSYWGALVAAGLDDTPPGPNSAAGSPTGGNDSGISGGSSNRPKVNNTMSPGLAGTTRSTGGNMSSPGGNSLVRASLNNTQAGSPGPAGSTSSSGRSAGLPGSPLRSPGQVNQPAAGRGSASQVPSNAGNIGPMAPVSTSDLAQRRSVSNRQSGIVGASTRGRVGLTAGGGSNLNDTVTQLTRDIRSGGGNVGSSQGPSGRPAGSAGGDDFENAMNRVADFAIANNIDIEEALLQFPTEAKLLDGIAVDVMRGQINYARRLGMRSLAEYISFQNRDNETRSLRLGSYPLSYMGALVAAGLDNTTPGQNSVAGSAIGGNFLSPSGGSFNRPNVNNNNYLQARPAVGSTSSQGSGEVIRGRFGSDDDRPLGAADPRIQTSITSIGDEITEDDVLYSSTTGPPRRTQKSYTVVSEDGSRVTQIEEITEERTTKKLYRSKSRERNTTAAAAPQNSMPQNSMQQNSMPQLTSCLENVSETPIVSTEELRSRQPSTINKETYDGPSSPEFPNRKDSTVQQPLTQGGVEEPLTQDDVEEPLTQDDVEEPLTQDGVEEPLTQDDVEEPLTQDDVEEPLTQDDVEEPLTQDVATEETPLVSPEELQARRPSSIRQDNGQSEQQDDKRASNEEIQNRQPTFVSVPGTSRQPSGGQRRLFTTTDTPMPRDDNQQGERLFGETRASAEELRERRPTFVEVSETDENRRPSVSRTTPSQEYIASKRPSILKGENTQRAQPREEQFEDQQPTTSRRSSITPEFIASKRPQYFQDNDDLRERQPSEVVMDVDGPQPPRPSQDAEIYPRSSTSGRRSRGKAPKANNITTRKPREVVMRPDDSPQDSQPTGGNRRGKPAGGGSSQGRSRSGRGRGRARSQDGSSTSRKPQSGRGRGRGRGRGVDSSATPGNPQGGRGRGRSRSQARGSTTQRGSPGGRGRGRSESQARGSTAPKGSPGGRGRGRSGSQDRGSTIQRGSPGGRGRGRSGSQARGSTTQRGSPGGRGRGRSGSQARGSTTQRGSPGGRGRGGSGSQARGSTTQRDTPGGRGRGRSGSQAGGSTPKRGGRGRGRSGSQVEDGTSQRGSQSGRGRGRSGSQTRGSTTQRGSPGGRGRGRSGSQVEDGTSQRGSQSGRGRGRSGSQTRGSTTQRGSPGGRGRGRSGSQVGDGTSQRGSQPGRGRGRGRGRGGRNAFIFEDPGNSQSNVEQATETQAEGVESVGGNNEPVGDVAGTNVGATKRGTGNNRKRKSVTKSPKRPRSKKARDTQPGAFLPTSTSQRTTPGDTETDMIAGDRIIPLARVCHFKECQEKCVSECKFRKALVEAKRDFTDVGFIY